MILGLKTLHSPPLCALQCALSPQQGLCLQLRLEWQWYDHIYIYTFFNMRMSLEPHLSVLMRGVHLQVVAAVAFWQISGL